MTIYHGVSMVELPDADETSVGGVTVANLNDTDGDGVIDSGDPLISSGGALFSGEDQDRDLMLLTLHRPLNCIAGKKITLSAVGAGPGMVNVWKTPQKIGRISLPKEYKCSELPIDVYVEIINYSNEARDIQLKMNYNGGEDLINVTAVWMKKTVAWLTRDECPDCPINPEAGKPGGRLASVDGPLENIINVTRISQGGSRYGHGYDTSNGTSDVGFGGRILFEFLFYPLNIEPQLLGVKFDVARHRQTKGMRTLHGGVPGTDLPSLNKNFSEYSDVPNDDEGQNDEDNEAGLTPAYDGFPAGYRIYSWDRPGITNIFDAAEQYAFWVTKNNFREFSRIQIFNSTDWINPNARWGSRASEMYSWSNIYYTKSGSSNSLMIPDDANTVSYSSPKKEGPGNGSCNVTLLSNAINAGYNVKFNYTTQRWELFSPPFGSPSIATSSAPSGNPRTWTLVYLDRISLQIVEGSSVFSYDSRFSFSVFRAANKINITSQSPIIIKNNEY